MDHHGYLTVHIIHDGAPDANLHSAYFAAGGE